MDTSLIRTEPRVSGFTVLSFDFDASTFKNVVKNLKIIKFYCNVTNSTVVAGNI